MWNAVWITGASSGIGRALALKLAATGTRVAATARSADRLGSLAAEAAGITSFAADVTDAPALAALAGRVAAEIGPVDLAILNAGTYAPVDTGKDFDAGLFRRTVEVNYLGVTNAIAAVLPGMLRRGAGHIAIVASVAGYRGLPKAAAYGPSKAALINLAEALKPELEPHGVRISIVNPGFVRTPMTARNDFSMPFLMEPGEAAERIIAGLRAGRYEIAFPRRFAVVLKILRLLPDAVFFRIVRKFVLRG